MIIEEIIQDFLIQELDCPVYMERPEKPPARYIILDKLGSSRENWIQHSQIAVQSYAESLYEAASLNESAKLAMDSLIYLDEICRSECNSDYNYTDTTTKQYRYQAVYEITHY